MHTNAHTANTHTHTRTLGALLANPSERGAIRCAVSVIGHWLSLPQDQVAAEVPEEELKLDLTHSRSTATSQHTAG